MSNLLESFPGLIYPINILDILIIAFATYKILEMIRGTRAVPLAKGVAIVLGMTVISEYAGLSTVNWVLVQLQKIFIIAIPVIFAPELRRALEQLGTKSVLPFNHQQSSMTKIQGQVNAIVKCMVAAQKTKTGVLIAITRENLLKEYVQTGILIQGELSTALLNNIFIPNTPLHDGAVIISDGRIIAASCFLPLSDNTNISMNLGTRHRAAIGLSEVSDAILLIVSEETGAMSLAEHGKLRYNLSEEALSNSLIDLLYKNDANGVITRIKKAFK